jgi:uncharacterized protein (TIGR03083 family)
MMVGPERLAYEQAAGFFVSAVEQARAEQWDSPGLDRWSVRDLVGHTSRALLTVETYLGQPASAVELETPVDYFVAALAGTGGPDQIAQRGREAGAALGPDPASAVREIADRVLKLLADADDEQLLSTPVGGMRLRDYLPTRTFELVVHTLDLAAALGVLAEPPPEPAGLSLQIAADLVLRSGRGAEVLLALTGRHPLPAGFSVV